MVRFDIFNSFRKLRVLSVSIYRGSKKLLGRSSAIPVQIQQPSKPSSQCLDVALHTERNELVQDADFFYSEADNRLCVFQVENTLFKIHRILLIREPSAFSDMFSIPRPVKDNTGTDTSPVMLSDTVEKFKDLLWALYAPPTELFSETRIDRLLNVLELANKYSFSSLESWVIQHIYTLSQDSNGPLRTPPSSLLARILHLSVLCHHRPLQDVATQNLICRILWFHASPELVLDFAEQYGLRDLLGVCYYKQLVKLEYTSNVHHRQSTMKTQFPESMSVEDRMQFLSAHESLLALWDKIRSSPPSFRSDACLCHNKCEDTWGNIWSEALKTDEAVSHGSADVLGRLKSVMMCTRNMLSDAGLSMSMSCKMATLESLSLIRDEIIEGLLTHFEETP